jgi:hypothetical protein
MLVRIGEARSEPAGRRQDSIRLSPSFPASQDGSLKEWSLMKVPAGGALRGARPDVWRPTGVSPPAAGMHAIARLIDDSSA